MLVRCLYASRPAVSGTEGTAAIADAILEQSRRNNPPAGITGLLCCTDDVFVQVIEGGRDAVCDLLGRIFRDTRHTEVRILVFEEIAERRFGNWTMGRVNLVKLNPTLLLKYSEKPALDPFAAPGQTVMSLLSDLVASAAIRTHGT
ncbi:MAG: BLUF domain-containing protein [Alphaproteobacteria bacterium]